MIVVSKFTFTPSYPLEPPTYEFTSTKGLDDDQIDEIRKRMTKELKAISEERKENQDDTGIIYHAHEKIREILTEYNDTLRGRCAICLENFHNDKD